MKKMLYWSIFLALVWLVSACSSPMPAPIQESTPTPPPADTPTPVVQLETVSFDEVMNITWQWTEVDATKVDEQKTVPDPESYTLTFLPAGILRVQADCNQITGSYTQDGSNLTLSTLGPSTMAACPDGSVDQVFLSFLNSVSSFGMQDSELILLLKDDAGNMTFANGGQAAPPGPEVCAGIQFESVTVEVQDLPYTWQKNCLPATAYESGKPPTPVGLPEHIQINFIPPGAQAAQPEDPVIYLIPIDAYQQLWAENGDQAVNLALVQLRRLLKDQPSPAPSSGLPTLPFEEVGGVNDLAVQSTYLEDENFIGLRFVGRFSQGPTPVTNTGLQYIFQGGTYGAEYLIAFFYPVSTAELPDSAADVPSEDIQMAESDPNAYLLEKEVQLNALEPADWEPDLTVLDAVIGSLQFEKASQEETSGSASTPGITNLLWRWVGLVESGERNPELIPDPLNYTLSFSPRGTFEVVSDCNWANGSYKMEGENLSMTIETKTEVICSPTSLSDQYMGLLEEVESYTLDGAQLNLVTNGGATTMLFTNLGPLVTLPEVPEGVPTAYVLEPLSIRSGPGTDYPSYGVVAIGQTAEVIGVSEDGGWWVIEVPADVNPERQGWVNANYVQVTDARDVPVVPNP